MKIKLIYLILFTTTVFGSGGYDNGTSAGKGILDISLTWNPFNFFEQGQSYVILGYGLTKRIDIHAYYSSISENNDNYYGGIFYQFLDTKRIDLATALGLRTYTKNDEKHIFFPQFLYTIYLTDKIRLGGSFVDIRSSSLDLRKGMAIDVFLSKKIYSSDKIIIDLSIGGFSPVLWNSKYGDWYPTYSFDFKFNNTN